MTRPTDEQIKALKKGDVVLIRATVLSSDGRPEPLVEMSREDGCFSADPLAIVSIEPRPLAVGDRVRKTGDDLVVWEVVCPPRPYKEGGVLEVAIWRDGTGYGVSTVSGLERIA